MRKELLEKIKKEYPIGTRIELVEMNDIQAPPVGTKGTVRGVDDIGSILVNWDNGSTLNLFHQEDLCRIIERLCPKCGNLYSEPPAISRADNETLICPECGTRESLDKLRISKDKQDKLLSMAAKFKENK